MRALQLACLQRLVHRLLDPRAQRGCGRGPRCARLRCPSQRTRHRWEGDVSGWASTIRRGAQQSHAAAAQHSTRQTTSPVEGHGTTPDRKPPFTGGCLVDTADPPALPSRRPYGGGVPALPRVLLAADAGAGLCERLRPLARGGGVCERRRAPAAACTSCFRTPGGGCSSCEWASACSSCAEAKRHMRHDRRLQG